MGIVQSLIDTYKYLKNNNILAGYPRRDDVARGKIGGARQAQIEGNADAVRDGLKDVSELGNTVLEIPTPPLSGITMTVQSTSSNDTLLGLNARKVIIEYIEPITEVLKNVEVELNGTTSVTVPVPIAFVSDFYVSDVPTLGIVADGDITIESGGTTYCIIKAGGNKSLQLYRYIPKGKAFYVTAMTVSSDTRGALVKLRATQSDNLTKLNNAFIFRTSVATTESSVTVPYDPPMVFTQGTYVKASILADYNQNGALVSVMLNGWIEDIESGTLNT